MKSESDSRLHFMIAGAQKCGTTALDAYLRLHRGLEMARVKETHFFDNEIGVDWRTPDYGPLHLHYRGDPAVKMRGEATPLTLYWTPAHHRILRYNPDMRFIFMLRHPTDRAWSHWRMNIRMGLDDQPFDWAIREGRLRVLSDGEHSGLARHSSYIERGWYGRQIASLASLFPLERMLFLKQADLAQAPDAVLARVAAFLEIEPFESVTPVHENGAPPSDEAEMTEADRAYLDEIFQPDLKRLRDLTGIDLSPAESENF